MKKIRVLVVDDSPFSQKIIENALKNSEYEVCGMADTGSEGIEKYRTCQPDIVAMDLTLPDINGLECCREILIFDPQAKIVIVSAMKDEGIINGGSSIGVRGFLQKPVRRDKLLAALHSALHNEQQSTDYQEQFVEYFRDAFEKNIIDMTGLNSEITIVNTSGVKFNGHGLSIIIGITGTKQGRMILDVSSDIAEQVTKKILGIMTVTEEDVLNSIAEFANIIAGHGVSQINTICKGNDFELRVTPPSSFIGTSVVIINPKMDSNTVTAQTEIGPIYMNVGFVGGK